MDDWEQYTERLDQYFAANGIEDGAKKLAVFLAAVGAKMYALLSNLLVLEKPAIKSYTKLMEVLKTHLKLKPVIIAERFHFHQRGQKEGKSVSSYMAALQWLAHLEEALGGYAAEAANYRWTHLEDSIPEGLWHGSC